MDKDDKKKLDEIISKIIQENLDNIMADRFSRYSKYIIQQRALPDARDGLKPVQRRILYSMSELGLDFTKPFKKSARVVGDVIGKYHPHGDSSIYEAMVRMAQDWKMGYTLLEMHGNVGSIDDDPAAAMRYTEVRLSEIANYVIGDLKKNTVKFAPNFDDSEKEPTVMPSLIPNLLVNGAKGIASGYATEMPPHNLGEVLDAAIAKIKNPDIQLSKLYKYVKGPDFPTGGVVYGQQGIYQAFERGHGRITLVSKYKTYEDSKNKYIEITEIPYGVIKSKLVHDIDLIIAGGEVAGLLEIKDQSDRNGVSILITLDKKANEEVILNYLLSKTEMQIYYSYNNVVILDNTPKVLGLAQLLDAYLKHLRDVKTKTLEFDLVKYQTRLEIVLGFLKVAEITDEVIKVIRQSENGKTGVIQNLMNHFGFTQNQANAISELRLYKLSKTDKEAFMLEKEELDKLIAHCKLLLLDADAFNQYLIELLQEIKKHFGRPRKTTINEENLKLGFDEVDLIKDEDVVLGVSKHGYLKRLSNKTVAASDFSTYGLKEEDRIIFYEKVNTLNNLLVLTNLGNYAIVPIYKIDESKWKDFGIHLSDFVELTSGEELVGAINVTDFNIMNYVCLFSKQGQGKRVVLKEFEVSRQSKTYTALKLRADDELVGAKLSNGYKDVLLITRRGMASLYSENDVQVYGTKSNGTKSCFMPPMDEITSFALVEPDEDVTLLANDTYIKRIHVADITRTSKKNLGKPLFNQMKTKPYVVHDARTTSANDELFVQDQANKVVLERIAEYPFTDTKEGFAKVKVPNLVNITIKKSEVTNSEINKPQISYTQSTPKEEKIMEVATKKVDDILDLDVDSILAKIQEKLKNK